MRNSSSLDWLRFMHTPNDYRVSRFFPVGVGTFPTELSGRLRLVLSPAEAVPETLAGYSCFRNIY